MQRHKRRREAKADGGQILVSQKRCGNKPYTRSDIECDSLVHQYRVAAGLTLRELAERTGVNMSSICELASGAMSPVHERSETLKPSAAKLCCFFKVKPEVLFPASFGSKKYAEALDGFLLPENGDDADYGLGSELNARVPDFWLGF
jgi:transcriptional regulator with XRE-family HTH domain